MCVANSGTRASSSLPRHKIEAGEASMSQLGHFQTSARSITISALPPMNGRRRARAPSPKSAMCGLVHRSMKSPGSITSSAGNSWVKVQLFFWKRYSSVT